MSDKLYDQASTWESLRLRSMFKIKNDVKRQRGFRCDMEGLLLRLQPRPRAVHTCLYSC
jgi:hypothetical protein